VTSKDWASCSSLSWPWRRAIATATCAAQRASAPASWVGREPDAELGGDVRQPVGAEPGGALGQRQRAHVVVAERRHLFRRARPGAARSCRMRRCGATRRSSPAYPRIQSATCRHFRRPPPPIAALIPWTLTLKSPNSLNCAGGRIRVPAAWTIWPSLTLARPTEQAEARFGLAVSKSMAVKSRLTVGVFTSLLQPCPAYRSPLQAADRWPGGPPRC